jgi:acyl dehydratase
MVPVGSKVRARSKLVSAELNPKSGGMQIINEVTIEIEGQDRPACVAEAIGIVFK